MAKTKTAAKVNTKTNKPAARPVLLDEDGFELIGGNGSAIEIGEEIQGIFGGVVRVMESKKKGMPPLNFYAIGTRHVMGNTILRMRIEEGNVKVGDELRVRRVEDIKGIKGRNDAKNFEVRVKRNS